MKLFKTSYNIRILLLSLGFCCICTYVHADSISNQRFTLSMQNQALSDVFQTLSNTSGFQILYNDALGNLRINLQLENATIETALQKILTHQNHTIVYDDHSGTIQIDVYEDGTSTQVRSTKPMPRQPLKAAPHQRPKHGGLKLSQKLLEKSAPQPEDDEVDETALIEHHHAKKELPPQAKTLFSIMSGEPKSKLPTANPK